MTQEWTKVEGAAKNDAGEYQVLVGGKWQPASGAAKNDAGEYMALMDSTHAAPAPSVMDSVKSVPSAVPGNNGIQFGSSGLSTVSTRAQDIAIQRAAKPKVDGRAPDTMAATSEFIKGSGSPLISEQSRVNPKPEVGLANAVESSGRYVDKVNADRVAERSAVAEASPYTSSLGAGAAQILSNVADTPAFVNDALKTFVVNPILHIAGQEGMEPTQRFAIAKDLQQAADEFTPKTSKLMDLDFNNPQEVGHWVAVNALKNAPQIATGYAASVIPKLRAAYLGLMGITSGAGQYQRNLENGVNQKDAMLDGVTNGAFEVIGEMTGFAAFDKIGGMIKAMPVGQRAAVAQEAIKKLMVGVAATAGQMTAEGTGEGITQVGQNLSQKYVAGDKSVGLMDGVPDAVAIGAIMGTPTALHQGAQAARQPHSDGAALGQALQDSVDNTQLDPRAVTSDALRAMSPTGSMPVPLTKMAADFSASQKAKATGVPHEVIAHPEDPTKFTAVPEQVAQDIAHKTQPVSIPNGDGITADDILGAGLGAQDPVMSVDDAAMLQGAQEQGITLQEDHIGITPESQDNLFASQRAQHAAAITQPEVMNGASITPAAPGLDATPAEQWGADATGSAPDSLRGNEGEVNATGDRLAGQPDASAQQPDAGLAGADNAVAARIDAAAHEAATSPRNDLPEPTQAQKEAGNYKKAHVSLHGLNITIENPKGSQRSGVDPDGKPWSIELPNHYGYIKRTEGADGDHVDTYIGPNPASRQVFVVDQVDAVTGKFDEHKIMIGYDGETAAMDAYRAAFNDGKGHERMGAVAKMNIEQFKHWLAEGNTKKPLAPQIQGAKKKAPAVSENLLARIKQLGGINLGHIRDVTGESNPKNVRAVGLFSKTGKGLDDLAVMLHDDGFDVGMHDQNDNGGVNRLSDQIRSALDGNTVLTIAATERKAAADAEVEYNHNIREQAKALGIKTVARKMAAIEADVIAHQEAVIAEKETALRKELDQLSVDLDTVLIEAQSLIGEGGVSAALRHAGEFIENNDVTDEAAQIRAMISAVKAEITLRKQHDETQDPDVRQVAEAFAGQSDRSGGIETGAGENQGIQSSDFSLTGQTTEEIAADERAQAAQDTAAREDEAKAKAEQAAKDQAAVDAKVKAHTDNADNFQFGESSKDAAAPEGDLFSQNQEASKSDEGSENIKFNSDLDAYLAGELKSGRVFILGTPGKILSKFGLSGLEIQMPQSIVKKGIEKHSVDAEDLRDLPMHIQNPLAVFASKTNPDARILLTEIAHPDGNLVVALHAEMARGSLAVHDIRSIHPKPGDKIAQWVEDGLLLGADKNKGRYLLPATLESNSQGGNNDATSGVILYDTIDKGNAKTPTGTSEAASHEEKLGVQPSVGAALNVTQPAEESKTSDKITLMAVSNKPFPTERAAQSSIKQRKLDATVVPVEGGFGIKHAPEQAAEDSRDNEAKKIEVLKAQASGKITGDQADAMKQLADAGEHVAVDNALKPSSPIDDFGEKISGAKKEYAAAYKDKMQAAKEADVLAQPLSKSWPEPDYQKLVDAGTDAHVVGLVRSLRDEILNKPGKSYRQKTWGAQVEQLRDAADRLLNDKAYAEKYQAELKKGENQRLEDAIGGRAELYALLGHEKSLKGIRISRNEYGIYNGIEQNPHKIIWEVTRDAKATAFGNMPATLGYGDTRQKAIDAFQKSYSQIDTEKEKSALTKFELYSDRKGKYFIGKKVGRNVIHIKDGFDAIREAREYLANNNKELTAILEQKKVVPNERYDINQPRVGQDMRNAQDVTPEMFTDAFGFRGVQFGNYVEGARRQKDLNNAYDALMDLAAVLGIPPKSLSLNGELGLAFGARGTGGIHPASAHYEPGQVVINLTKANGAGSLAHEWWHSLDNYFSRQSGKSADYTTDRLDVRLAAHDSEYHFKDDGIRKEMIDAFGAVMKAIQITAIKERSRSLDRRRAKAYWGTDTELSARSFERYVIAKLHDSGFANDYLANVVSEEYWNDADALGIGEGGSYPYPTESELPAIRSGFDQFFQVIESKETDNGVALFSYSDPLAEIRAQYLAATRKGMSTEAVSKATERLRARWLGFQKVNIVQSFNDLPDDLKSSSMRSGARDAEGVYGINSKQVYLVADNLRSPDHAVWVAIHETVGHAGLRMLDSSIADIITNVSGNPTVAKLAQAISKDRDETFNHAKHTEEALAELAAAQLADGTRELLERYGVDSSGITSNGLVDSLKRIIETVRRFIANAIGKKPADVSDAEVRSVIDSARMAVEGVEQAGQKEEGYALAASTVENAGAVPEARSIGFPADSTVMSDFSKDSAIKMHAQYKAAKSGDIAAAVKLVSYLVKPSNIEAARAKFGTDVAYVPVMAQEASGKNQIPNALASYYAQQTGGMKASGIYQINKAYHTGADPMERIVARSEFSGKVIQGQKYVLVDDVSTMGGTLADMASYIQSQGGVVSGAVVLTNASRSGKMIPDAKVIRSLGERHGKAIRELFGIEPGALTHDESKYLIGFRTTDELRNRAASAIAERGRRVLSKAVSGSANPPALNQSSGDEPLFSKPSQQPAQSTQEAEIPDETAFQRKRRQFQDHQIRWKVTQDSILEQGGKIEDKSNVSLALKLFPGRVSAAFEAFQRNTIDPLYERATKGKFHLADIEEYLYAMHAPERNAQIAKINDRFPDGGSGMTNAEAAKIILKYRQMDNFEEFKALADDFRKITTDTQKMLVKYGVHSQAHADSYSHAYKQYVPLKGFEAIDADGKLTGNGTGSGHSTNGKLDKRAKGRASRAGQILSNIIRDHEAAITAAEKANVGRVVRNFVEANPNDKMWTVEKIPQQDVVIKSARKIDDTTDTLDPSWGKNKVGEKVVKRDAQFDPEKEIQFIEGDNAVRIQFADSLLPQAYNKTCMDLPNEMFQHAANFNAFLRQVYTQKNPAFFLMNPLRDVQSMVFKLTSEVGVKTTAQAFKHWPAAWLAVMRYALQDKATTSHLTGKAEKAVFGDDMKAMAPWMNRYRKAGGSVGFAYIGDITVKQEKIENQLRRIGGVSVFEELGKMWQAGMLRDVAQAKKHGVNMVKRATFKLINTQIFDLIEHLNLAFENASRLATFRACVESGMSDAQAALQAKNVTTNFNDKGEQGSNTNALYLFANANIQGSANLAKALTKAPHARKAWAMVAGIAALGFMAGMADGDDEDDTEPGYEAQRYWRIDLGEGKRFTIPKPYGWSFFYDLGRSMAHVTKNKNTIGDESVAVASSFLGNFSPLGNPIPDDKKLDWRNAVAGSMPTIIKPAVQVAVNRNSFGRPLFPENSNKPNQPDSEKAWRKTRGGFYDDVAKGLNHLTGGDVATSGLIDVSPETLKLMATFLTGGSGRFLTDSYGTGGEVLSGDGVTWENAPIVRMFYRTTDVDDYRARFYQQADEVKALQEKVSTYKTAKEPEKAQAIRQGEDGNLLRLKGQVKRAGERIADMRDEEEAVRSNEALSSSEKKAEIKAIEQKQIDRLKEFNAKYRNAKYGLADARR